MKTNHYLQKLIVKRISNDDEYLGIGGDLGPEVIDLMSLKKQTIGDHNAYCSDKHAIELDEYELAMAS